MQYAVTGEKVRHIVALRKESVDRNPAAKQNVKPGLVALRKESVDRNTVVAQAQTGAQMSLSARRAWIEMWRMSTTLTTMPVALRKESVDRNIDDYATEACNGRSLSARRAWIEIPPSKRCAEIGKRRSPQGERG